MFEKADHIGGLLRYGIPDFKLDRALIDRRIVQTATEGVIFRTSMEIGVTVPVQRILDDYDVMVLTGGAQWPRDLGVPGRQAGNIHFAMDYLIQQKRRNAGRQIAGTAINAAAKHVVVIGGGDTDSDCIGTASRQAPVTQLEIMPMPPEREDKPLVWPHWQLRLRNTTSHDGGAERLFATRTIVVSSASGPVEVLVCDRDGDCSSTTATGGSAD